jgi:hypothetical protein
MFELCTCMFTCSLHQTFVFQVIDAYIGDLSLRVGDDRYLCAAWRSSFLLEQHRKGQKTKKSKKNDDHLAIRTGTIQRVVDEYFRRQKVKYSINMTNFSTNTNLHCNDNFFLSHRHIFQLT